MLHQEHVIVDYIDMYRTLHTLEHLLHSKENKTIITIASSVIENIVKLLCLKPSFLSRTNIFCYTYIHSCVWVCMNVSYQLFFIHSLILSLFHFQWYIKIRERTRFNNHSDRIRINEE